MFNKSLFLQSCLASNWYQGRNPESFYCSSPDFHTVALSIPPRRCPTSKLSIPTRKTSKKICPDPQILNLNYIPDPITNTLFINLSYITYISCNVSIQVMKVPCRALFVWRQYMFGKKNMVRVWWKHVLWNYIFCNVLKYNLYNLKVTYIISKVYVWYWSPYNLITYKYIILRIIELDLNPINSYIDS